MRILHVSEPHTEGVFGVIRHLSAVQVRLGHDVHLLSPRGTPRLKGVTHHDWSVRRRRPLSYSTAVRQLRRTSAASAPDVLHLHSFFAGLLGRTPLSRAHAHPVVYQPHAWATERFDHPAARRLVARLERRAAGRTDELLVNCEDELRRGRDLGIGTLGRVVGVPIDTAALQPVHDRAERARRREHLGLPEQRVVLVLGRLSRQKGQDLAVAAWERRPPDGALLCIVGPGDARPLAALAPTQWGRTIRAFGATDDPAQWHQAADVLWLPSRYETVGLVVAEALASGLPVVAADVDGVAWAVQDPPHPPGGEVVAGDAHAGLDAVRRRLDDDERWRQESVAGALRARALFDLDAYAAAVSAAYEEAIAAHRHGGRERQRA